MDIEFHRRRKRITINELRLEEYAGRLTHQNGQAKMDYSQVGAPNIRIRTGADFELGEEAEIFLTELRRRIQYMGLLKGIPVESVIRCNAYVALAHYPKAPDYFVKLRNLNSFNFVRKAINAELHRQEEILTSGGAVVSESRLWNERQDRTEFHQARESASTLETKTLSALGAFSCPASLLAELRASAVEHPSERQNRLIASFGIARSRAEFICDEKSRADFFEQTIACGAPAMESAHWLMSDVTGLLRRAGLSIQESPLSPRRFASILELYNNKSVNSHIAKLLIQAVIETDQDPLDLLEKHNWKLITDEGELSAIVGKVVQDNAAEVKKLKDGEMAPLEFLTGLVMKKTRGLADPTAVKKLLKDELKISVTYVIAMGGTISGNLDGDEVSAGDGAVLKSMVPPELAGSHISFETVLSERLFSEELQPADWAALIHAIAVRIASGTANGIVVTHGTDTLAYTAPLVHWLFADAGVPIVLTASNAPPSPRAGDDRKADDADEARANFAKALHLAQERDRGVFVVFGGRVLSPVNLKFVKPALAGFTNWNAASPTSSGQGLLTDFADTDRYVMSRILSEAANSMFMCRVYPGMRADRLLSLADEGVRFFFLELYEKGTANMKEGPWSLKPLLTQGRKRNCRFFCTSQQEGVVDFSGYSTSRRMWREGAIPMGQLTTETAIALYFAASSCATPTRSLRRSWRRRDSPERRALGRGCRPVGQDPARPVTPSSNGPSHRQRALAANSKGRRPARRRPAFRLPGSRQRASPAAIPR
jgi:aspartyl-tRNA(Asn)/glutamyl-tRNA(Gln) amidotransferase subunit B